MASNSETGHARNVANFQTLINHCTSLGAIFQPFNDALKLTALEPQLVACKAANSAVKDPLIAYNDQVSLRTNQYAGLDKLTTRLLNMFFTTKALKQEKDFAKTIADKIRGKKNKPPKEEGQDSYSTSQQSFVMLADNFETLVGILAAEPTYTPAETDLQVTALQTMLANMNTLNNDADLAYRLLKGVRTTRNTALYAEGTGLVDTALDVKKYLKGAFGTKSPNYKAISGLKFVRIADDPNK
ncbi:MAG: hypothetical protein GC192_23860 [Bacteroidetes bacterium]|nr:hypothetical protein [Bacteroidota bacterium]